MDRPIVAVTMGDPAGIGPELVVKVLAEETTYEQCRPLVVGDVGVMEEIAGVLHSELRFRAVEIVGDARFVAGTVDVLRPEGLHVERRAWGVLDSQMGDAAARCLRTAIELGQDGQVHGMVAAPMNKEAFHLAGYDYLDELAFLADVTGSRDTFLAGLVGSLWTAAVTEHIAFRAVADQITQERVLHSIRGLAELMRRAGRSQARIAVAALNPHGGEGGLFGREEIDEIAPAVMDAQEEGLDAQGPYPADTVFIRAKVEGFDAVLCLYHDQANIARKLLGTWDGATVFAGLPIPCATTAHGTAFDRAGQGTADPGSLAAALACVATLARG